MAQLRIEKDQFGEDKYILIDDNGKVKTIGVSLVKYKVSSGDIENAYIDDNGKVRLNNDTDSKIAGVKSAERIKKENELSEKLGKTKFELIAQLVDDDGNLRGYAIRNLDTFSSIKVTVSTAIIYASIGALSNARVTYDGDGREILMGIGINISNLVKMGAESGKRVAEKTESMRIADSVIQIRWDEVSETAEKLQPLEQIDRRAERFGGQRYPRVSLLNSGTLKISVDRVDYTVSVQNLDKVVRDETDILVLSVRAHNSANTNYKVMCANVSYIYLNVYVIGLAAFVALKKLNRRCELTEVNFETHDGRMWRLYFIEDNSHKEVKSDDGFEITAQMLSALNIRYSMKLSPLSGMLDVATQDKLIRKLKIDKACVSIHCQDNVYKSESVNIRSDDNRIDVRLVSDTGEIIKFYFCKLQKDKINLKNIIVLCATAISDRSEIVSASVVSLVDDAEFLVEFTSKIK